MKIALISNLDGPTPVGNIMGYNQVLCWFLGRELEQMGHEVTYQKDKAMETMELGPSRGCDAAIAASARAIISLRESPILLDSVRRSCCRLYRLSDGPMRSIYPWGGQKSAGAYFGLGGDYEHCMAEQQTSPRVILFNAWNKPVQDGTLRDDYLYLAAVVDRGWVVWSVNAPVCVAKRQIGRELPGKVGQLGYVPWLEMMAATRRASIFLDLTPKVIELGRVEASCCGALVLHPYDGHVSRGEGVHCLEEWRITEHNVFDVLMQAMSWVEYTSPHHEIRRRALHRFNWPTCAGRITAYLESER